MRWWSAGNETARPEEIGQAPAADDARGVGRFATAIRAVDPIVRLVVVGEPPRSAAADAPAVHVSGWSFAVAREAGAPADALWLSPDFPSPTPGRLPRDGEADVCQLAAGADPLWVAGVRHRVFERAGRVRLAMVSHLGNCTAPIQTREDRMFVTSGDLVQSLDRRRARRWVVPVRVGSDQFRAPAFGGVRPSTEPPGVSARPATEWAGRVTADEHRATGYLASRRPDGPLALAGSGLPPSPSGRLRYLGAASPWSRNDVAAPDALGFGQRPVEVSPTGACAVELPAHCVAALVVHR